MKQKELLNIAHTTANVGSIITIVADDGYMITDWKEGSDISTFNSFRKAYMPIKDTYPNYRTITKEESDKMDMEKDKIINANLLNQQLWQKW